MSINLQHVISQSHVVEKIQRGEQDQQDLHQKNNALAYERVSEKKREQVNVTDRSDMPKLKKDEEKEKKGRGKNTGETGVLEEEREVEIDSEGTVRKLPVRPAHGKIVNIII